MITVDYITYHIYIYICNTHSVISGSHWGYNTHQNGEYNGYIVRMSMFHLFSSHLIVFYQRCHWCTAGIHLDQNQTNHAVANDKCYRPGLVAGTQVVNVVGWLLFLIWQTHSQLFAESTELTTPCNIQESFNVLKSWIPSCHFNPGTILVSVLCWETIATGLQAAWTKLRISQTPASSANKAPVQTPNPAALAEKQIAMLGSSSEYQCTDGDFSSKLLQFNAIHPLHGCMSICCNMSIWCNSVMCVSCLLSYFLICFRIGVFEVSWGSPPRSLDGTALWATFFGTGFTGLVFGFFGLAGGVSDPEMCLWVWQWRIYHGFTLRFTPQNGDFMWFQWENDGRWNGVPYGTIFSVKTRKVIWWYC